MSNMVDKVIDYCRKTKQPIPANEGEIVLAVLQGLAMRYRNVVEKLEEMSGKQLTTIHIVGGGTKNRLLNQLTADALGRKVVTGPIEATAIGNLIVQAIGNGDIANWQEGVAVICDSFEIETYTPGEKVLWDEAYLKFKDNIDTAALAF
jgi:sugar (pentulose or hexulose) kinase